MRCQPLILTLVLLLSCQEPPLFPTRSRAVWQQERERRYPKEPPAPPAPGSTYYLTAIAFPSWARWEEGDFRGAEAVLFRGGEELLRTPAGARPDAERVRFLGGDLWTDEADGGSTRIRCNGQLRLSYEGEELLRGFLLRDGAVHTLGQRPGGKGFCYRIDGQEVFSQPYGLVQGTAASREWPGGAFCADSTGVYYVYAVPLQKGTAVRWEYHVMRGAEPVETFQAQEQGTLYDVRVRDGIVYRAEQRNASASSLCLVKGGLFLSLDVGPKERLQSCCLVPYGDGLAVKGWSVPPGRNSCVWLRTQEGLVHYIEDNYPIADLLLDQGLTAYYTVRDGQLYGACLDMRHLPVPPDGYGIADPRCAAFSHGNLALALSRSGGPQLLLTRDSTYQYAFNGFFTSVTIE